MPDVGTLQVSLVSNRGKRPITDAAVEISSAGEPDKILEVLKTDLSGQTEVIELETPPLEYSMEPGLNQPYSEYNLKITAPGFEPVEIAGSQRQLGCRETKHFYILQAGRVRLFHSLTNQKLSQPSPAGIL